MACPGAIGRRRSVYGRPLRRGRTLPQALAAVAEAIARKLHLNIVFRDPVLTERHTRLIESLTRLKDELEAAADDPISYPRIAFRTPTRQTDRNPPPTDTKARKRA